MPKLKKLRSLKLADILNKVAVFDLIIASVLILTGVVVLNSNPLSSFNSSGQDSGIAALAIKGGKKGGGKDGGNTTPTTGSLKIDEIIPSSGPVGTKLTILGTGFTDNNSIKVKGKIIASNIPSVDGNTIIFTLPTDIPCKPLAACAIKILISNEKGESNAVPFKVTAGEAPPQVDELLITTNFLPNGTEEVYYEQTLLAGGGVTPYDWSVSQGSLPQGLTLEPNFGIISGVPSQSGTYTFTAQVSDNNGSTNTKQLSIQVEAASIPISSITIRGRFVDYFTNEPIAGVTFPNRTNDTTSTITPSDANGEFSIQTTVSDLAPLGSGNSIKSFVYYPSCYYYAQSVSARRLADASLQVDSNMFDLDGSPKVYPVTSEIVDLGDVTIWPATRVQMNFDREMKPMIWYPEEGRGTGHANFIMNTTGFMGGNIIPFDYNFTLELTDRDGNVFTDSSYSHDRANGCNNTATLNFSNGEFNWSSE